MAFIGSSFFIHASAAPNFSQRQKLSAVIKENGGDVCFALTNKVQGKKFIFSYGNNR